MKKTRQTVARINEAIQSDCAFRRELGELLRDRFDYCYSAAGRAFFVNPLTITNSINGRYVSRSLLSQMGYEIKPVKIDGSKPRFKDRQCILTD